MAEDKMTVEYRGRAVAREHEAHGSDDEAAIKRLARLSLLEYEKVRSDEAERLGVRAPILDKLVKAAQSEADEDTSSGRRFVLEAPEPWPEPVQLSALLSELTEAIDRHMVMLSMSRDVAALWIAHTWVADRFQHTPRLAITSPEKRCGKSTLMDLLRSTSHKPIKADSISASAVFRTVEAYSPLTILIDEADTFLSENEELRGVLNAGFEKSGMVVRVVEQQGELVPGCFRTFCPVALAAIGSLPGTLEDRSIPVRLERKAASQTVKKMRDEGSRAALEVLARKLARWANDEGDRLSANPSIPPSLNDREGDICVPLLAIADAAGAAWTHRGREALIATFGRRAKDEDAAGTGTMLLTDIRSIFKETGSLRIPSIDLVQKLVAMEDRAWGEWKAGKPMTQIQLARVLKAFGVKPQVMRTGASGTLARAYQKDHFEDVWERYAPEPTPKGDLTRNSETSQLYSGNIEKSDPLHQGGRYESKNGHHVDINSDVSLLRVKSPSEGTYDDEGGWI